MANTFTAISPNDAFFAMSTLPAVGTVAPGSSVFYSDPVQGPLNETLGFIDTNIRTATEVFVGASLRPGAVVLLNQPFSVSGVVIISADAIVSSQFSADASSQLQVAGVAVFAPGASIVFSASQPGTFVVLLAASFDGTQFLQTAVQAAPGPCAVVTSGTAVVAQNTISVTVVVGECSSGLSTGALVGIIVGSIVGAALVTAAAVLLIRHAQVRQDAAANKAIARSGLQELKGLR